MTEDELLLITNNPRVKEQINLVNYWVEGDCKEVIIQAYNRVAMGHVLISHPLAGSLMPNQNPYKSILISKLPGEVDIERLRLVENCLRRTEELMENKNRIDLKAAYGQDLQLVDQDLILSALQSLKKVGEQ